MLRVAALLALTLLTAAPAALAQADPPAAAKAPPAAERFEAARRELVERSADLPVTGSRVGRGAQPGRFYELALELAETGDEAALVALARHETSAVVRAAGLVALARRFPEAAARELESRLDSRAELELCATGCTFDVVTEGELARRLLENADMLEPERPARPLKRSPG